ncbi:hypothetical protein EIP86_005925 [Pleurotus ostreatoroseus]|nr:hypothetical protein EIP86_005925 [Pleurotus ostreatoroseus]
MSNNNNEPYARVNSARLPDYKGKGVRMICKIETIDSDTDIAVVKTSDGGEVRVKLLNNASVPVKDPFVEIVGTAVENDLVKMQTCINLGSDFGACRFSSLKTKLSD